MRRDDQTESGESTVAPVRRVRDVLLELGAALHKYGIYPSGHPMRVAALETASAALRGLVQGRPDAAIGVARSGFLFDGDVVPAGVPVLRELARRLNARRVGAVTFLPDIGAAELDALLTALVSADDSDVVAVGGRGYRLVPLSYEHLTIGVSEDEGAAAGSAQALWEALARAALDGPASGADGARSIALAVDERRRELPYVELIATQLGRLLHSLDQRRDGSAETVSLQVTEVLRALDPQTLRVLAWLNGESGAQEFLTAAALATPPDALVRLLASAGSADAPRRPSQALLRLIARLGVRTRAPDPELGTAARAEVRRSIRMLVEGWSSAEVNPEAYATVLDTLSFRPLAASDAKAPPEISVERVLEISQELGAWGAAAERAVQKLLDDDDLPRLLAIIRDMDEDNAASRAIAERVLTPRLIYMITSREPVDRDALLDVSGRMGEAAVEPLLHELAESPRRGLRRTAFDCLTRIGAPAAAHALKRAADPRWYVTRNMLALAASAPLPPDFDPMPFVTAADARVRAQAVAIVADHPAASRALHAALQDTDPRVVTAALNTLGRARVTAELVEPLQRLAEREGAEDDRLAAVRALGRCRSPEACTALVALSGARRNWIRRLRIRRSTPVSLEALRMLARSWPDSRAAGVVLAAAAASTDSAVRRAAAGE